MILIANKCDQERQITDEEARTYAKDREMLYFEVSAKTGEGIEEAFH